MHFAKTKLVLAAALAAAMLAACAAPAEPGHMVPDRPAATSSSLSAELLGRVALGEVGGGEETDPLDVSKVGSAELREALRLSLQRNGLLSGDGAAAQFNLDAFLVELRQPRSGFTLNVHAFVRYKLTRVADGRLLIDEILDGSYTATTSDAFVGIERLKIANEGAVRQSIAAFLDRLNGLSAADLSGGLVSLRTVEGREAQ